MIVHVKEIISKAQKGGYAVGAFSTVNLETTLGIVRAAKNQKSPAIIQISEKTVSYAGLRAIFAIISEVAETEGKNVPLAIHLDHGKDFAIFSECVKIGFSSVHFDASAYPLAQNIKLTRKAADLGHKFGAWVQGELGSLFGQEGLTKVKLPKDFLKYLTDPDSVAEFVKKSGIDTLAVAVGTMHGNFGGQEKIDLNRLQSISKKTSLPLVLHGGSGAKENEIKKAIKAGVRIVNIDTDLRIAFTKILRQTLKKENGFYDPRKILTPSILAVQKEVEKKMVIFGSRGRA